MFDFIRRLFWSRKSPVGLDEKQAGKIYDWIRAGELEKLADIFTKHPAWVHEKYSLMTWLEIATRTENIPTIQFFMDRGLSINTPGMFGSTVLEHAAGKSNIALIKWMLDQGADPNAGISALAGPIAEGNLVVVKLLVEHGADVNKAFNETTPRTPLFQAIDFGRTEIADYLRSVGAKMP